MGSLLHWTPCPPDHRADLEQDRTDTAGETPRVSSGREVCPQVSQACLREIHTPGNLLTPAFRRQDSLTHGAPGQSLGRLDGIVRAGHRGNSDCPQLHTSSAQELHVSWGKPRPSQLLVAGMMGRALAQGLGRL